MLSGRHLRQGFVARLWDVLAQNHQNLPMMACNLLRFCTWQALPVLPLLIAGIAAARHERRAIALATGFAAPILLMAVLLPYQGHGFGYRYAHQVMGNAALLAGFGWRALAPWHARLRPMVARGFALSVLVVLPAQAWLAHGIYAPFARTSARIDATHADYAIIGAGDGPYALDLVLNRPDLSNRPIRLSAGDIDDSDALAARLCASGHATVALPDDGFFDDISHYFHAPRLGQASGRLAEQATAFSDAGCHVIRMSAGGDTAMEPQP